jgi:hypothetical protein
MTSFNPGTSTLERLLELTREVDFAAFVFAQDDWTASSPSASSQPGSGLASPRDNVVFEAGLFGGVLGMRRTFILHASGAKLPSDLLGLTCVRCPGEMTPSEMRIANQNPKSNRERRSRCTHRGLMVAVFLDGAHRKGAFRPRPVDDFARPQRRSRTDGPRMARGRKPLGKILGRGGEGAGRLFRPLLLLEG